MNEKVSRLHSVGLSLGSICLPALLVLFSCANPALGPTGTTGSTDASIKTLAWQYDGAGYIQYYSNDPANVQSQGYSEWCYYDPAEPTMSAVDVSANKISGDASMAFGIIFCVQDAMNFMTVNIDTAGYYRVGKIVAGSYVSIVDWTDSAGLLYSGYSVRNTIKVVYDSVGKVFALYLNGAAVPSFADPAAPFFTGGRSGFLIGISSTENFPNTPVDIRFRRVLPSAVP